MFTWTSPKLLSVDRHVSSDQRIYIISDLHLGDGTRSDAFMDKDEDLIQLIHQVRDENAHLVIAGDAIDFHQAWSMSRVLRAHARLIGELSRLAESHGVTYIWGNHDYDISLFKDLLRFDVCSQLRIGDIVLVQHGYEYDPFIGPNLDQTHVATRVHHLVERILDTWIRLPMQYFYTLPTRVTFWIAHKVVLGVQFTNRILRAMGQNARADATDAVVHYWAQAQLGNPASMFEYAGRALVDSNYQYLVTGHSHLPGQIEVAPGQFFVNTGSWTFNSRQYAVWDGEGFTVRDWRTGRVYDDRAFLPLKDRRFAHMSFIHWWRANYMGWLRYRVGEELRLPRFELNRPNESGEVLAGPASTR